jgi:hypothetical protein
MISNIFPTHVAIASPHLQAAICLVQMLTWLKQRSVAILGRLISLVEIVVSQQHPAVVQLLWSAHVHIYCITLGHINIAHPDRAYRLR